jgi:hypothetical protein
LLLPCTGALQLYIYRELLKVDYVLRNVIRNVLNNVHQTFECALSHARVTTPPMMIRSAQVPALHPILRTQVAVCSACSGIMFLVSKEMKNPEPGVRFGKVNDNEWKEN